MKLSAHHYNGGKNRSHQNYFLIEMRPSRAEISSNEKKIKIFFGYRKLKLYTYTTVNLNLAWYTVQYERKTIIEKGMNKWKAKQQQQNTQKP